MKTDTKLKEALVAQLNYWLGGSASNIEIAVNDGIVSLQGCVPTYEEKKECAKIVQRIGGVRQVVDEVRVEIPETRRPTDAETAAAAVNAINWITTLPPNSVKITPHAGRLILEGAVENCLQREAVEYVVRHLPGISGINNLITTRPQPLQSRKSAFEQHELAEAG